MGVAWPVLTVIFIFVVGCVQPFQLAFGASKPPECDMLARDGRNRPGTVVGPPGGACTRKQEAVKRALLVHVPRICTFRCLDLGDHLMTNSSRM